MKQSKTQDHYTTYEREGQVVLTLNEELDYRELYRAYSSKGRKSAANPRVMFKVMVYGYQCGIYSSGKRKMKEDHMRNGQLKPSNHEQQKSARFRKQSGRMENMAYDADEDCYTCANGRKLPLRRECTEERNGHFIWECQPFSLTDVGGQRLPPPFAVLPCGFSASSARSRPRRSSFACAR